jgi:hypothetical protein
MADSVTALQMQMYIVGAYSDLIEADLIQIINANENDCQLHP